MSWVLLIGLALLLGVALLVDGALQVELRPHSRTTTKARASRTRPPFPGADQLLCTTCHDGNGKGDDQLSSHVPPGIGDQANLASKQTAYFNRLTLTGIDKYPDYTVDGTTYSALDCLQFINPGDLRVMEPGRSCGQCHGRHADPVSSSLLATRTGILSGATFAFGIDNFVPASGGLYEDTAADLGFRARFDAGFVLQRGPSLLRGLPPHRRRDGELWRGLHGLQGSSHHA